MSYSEQLDSTMAQILLGDEYKEGTSYTLVSDRDKFVISGVDATGKAVDEVVLDATPTEDEFIIEDDLFLNDRPTKRKSYTGTIIASTMLALCALSVALVVLLLKEVR